MNSPEPSPLRPPARLGPPPSGPGGRRPKFVWQAVLIVLPVLVLTFVGLLSLRRDRLLAEQEARERAGQIAQELADRARARLFEVDPASQTGATIAAGTDLHRPAFEITPQLELLWPKAVESLPLPRPFDLSGLSAGALREREQARQATLAGDFAAATNAWARFLAGDPPVALAADASYQLAEAVARAGDANWATAQFQALASQYPDAIGESGLPLASLALWRAAEVELAHTTNPARRRLLFHSACSNLVNQPTALTPLLLGRIEELVLADSDFAGESSAPTGAGLRELQRFVGTNSVAAWRQLWEKTELARALCGGAQTEWRRRGLVDDPATNATGRPTLFGAAVVSPIWVDLARPATAMASGPRCVSSAWLLTRFPPSAPAMRFYGWTECELTNLVAEISRQMPSLPAYFSVGVTTGGRTLPRPTGDPLLAERAAADSAQPGVREPKLSACVYLSDPAALYAYQRQRTWWFLGVVLAAATTAGIGLAAAYRAFQRQLRLNELKSNFVSSVSHELRAPIASVRLLAESLDRGKITDESKRRDYFRLIGQECRRLSSLIENILDFSRIDQGRKQYEFEPTDARALVEQTVQLMAPYATERQVTLRFDPPSSLNLQPSLDGKAIQQALVNLIDNAVKHSPAGGEVTVALSASNPSAPMQDSPRTTPAIPPPITDHCSLITLSVTDHGPGIPSSEHVRIFEPFYRRGSELRRETTGVGIGLSIVKHVVEAHGGAVRVESELGRGSRFTIALPAGQAQSPKFKTTS